MDKFNLLADLADGILDNDQESMLFSELAVNDELRSEFKQLLVFNSSIKNNKSLFKVEPKSSAVIFSTLGISEGTAGISGATGLSSSSKIIGKVSNTFIKYSQAFTGGIFATAATAALFLLLIKPLGFFDSSKSEKTSQINLVTSNKSNNLNQVPNTFSYEADSKKSTKSNDKIKYIYVNRYINSNNDIALNDVNENNSKVQNNIIKLDFSNIEIKSQSFKSPYFHKFGSLNIPIIDLTTNSSIAKSNKNGIEIELRGSQNWNLPTESISPSKIAEFNNTAISGIYNLNENLSFGVDLRQETFFQHFIGNDKMGIMNTYEQQPNFTTYNAVIRLGYNVFDNFKPIAQVAIGGTNVGYIVRSLGGLQYHIYPELKFILAVEYSSLFYSYQSQSYNSDKFGLSYGVSYSF